MRYFMDAGFYGEMRDFLESRRTMLPNREDGARVNKNIQMIDKRASAPEVCEIIRTFHLSTTT